ncbi:hypothetical protein K1719_020939 [Acacia pycnantha]|nr:hypothetical protein K1719_020939 [Acacia pycnantha]
MASPPSPKPLSLVATTASPTKKPQSIPWTHQETINLIQAYQDKWYSLKRGPLKANQWEEVAVTVAVRCGYDYNEPSKTAVQCRHKMEKLRQRYRAENYRLAASSSYLLPRHATLDLVMLRSCLCCKHTWLYRELIVPMIIVGVDRREEYHWIRQRTNFVLDGIFKVINYLKIFMDTLPEIV